MNLVFFPFFLASYLLQSAIAQQCNQDFNSTHCLLCASGKAAPSSDLIIEKAKCVDKLTTKYERTILIKATGDSETYANVTKDQITDNFLASLEAEELEARKYVNPKLTYLLTVAAHSITATTPKIYFAGVDDLTLTIISMPCAGKTTCDATWFSSLTIDTSKIHFFVSKLTEIHYMNIKGSNGASCTGIGCFGTFMVENLAVESTLLLSNVNFLNYDLEYNLEEANSIIQIGKSKTNLTLSAITIENSKLDSLAYQHQTTKNLLSEYLIKLYSITTISVTTKIASALHFSTNNLNLKNHNVNVPTTSNLNKTNRNFKAKSSGLVYLEEKVTKFDVQNVVLENAHTISSNHILFYLKDSLDSVIKNVVVKTSSEFGLFYCYKCGTANLDQIEYISSTLHSLAELINSTSTVLIKNIKLTSSKETKLTIKTEFIPNLQIETITLATVTDFQISIKGEQNKTETSISKIKSTKSYFQQKTPMISIIHTNLTVNLLDFIDIDSSLKTARLIHIEDPLRLSISSIYVKNTNFWEIMQILSLNLPVKIDNFTCINITSPQETSYIISFGSKILDFTMENSLFTNHSGIVVYASNNFVSKNVTMNKVNITNSNVSDARSLLMWHFFANAKFTDCVFQELLVKELRDPPQPALDLFFFFGISSVDIKNTKFINMGFMTWRYNYVYGGTDYSLFSFWSNSEIKFTDCIFSVDERKLNHHFLSFILISNLIEITGNKFISTKKDTATEEYRSCYGLNLNTPKLINITKNEFENYFCYKFTDWRSQYITSYAPISVFVSSNTENIVKGKTVIISSNNFTKMHCNLYGGTLSVLNYENATIENNRFKDSYAPIGAIFYSKAIQNLKILNNVFEDGKSDDAFVVLASVVNAELRGNIFRDSTSKLNARHLLSTLSVGNLNTINSTFTQSTYQKVSKSAILVDSSTTAVFDQVTVQGSQTTNDKSTAMDIVRCTTVEIKSTIITNTENDKFYAIHFDTNVNTIMTNTTFFNNYRRLIAFNDFQTVTLDGLNITGNHERSAGESVFYFESQSVGKVDIKNTKVYKNTYKEISLIDMLTNSHMIIDNLDLQDFKGRLLYAYLYFKVPVEIKNSLIQNNEFPYSMVFGVYLNLTISNITLKQVKFTRYAIILTQSNFNFKGLNLIKVEGTEKISTECFFGAFQSEGNVQVKELDTVHFGNLLCIKLASACTILDTNLIAKPSINKYRFLVSEFSTINVKSSVFGNFNETIFELSSSYFNVLSTTFDSQLKTASPIADFKDTRSAVISGSTFKLKNIVVFYLYSTDYFKIENSQFIGIGNDSSFSILEMQSCNSFNIYKTNITNFTYERSSNYSIKSLFYLSDIKIANIDNLNAITNSLDSIPILSIKDISNLTIQNSYFSGNSFKKSNSESTGITCISIDCAGTKCSNHSLKNSSFSYNKAVNSFPIFYSNYLIKLDSVSLTGNEGYSKDFPYLMFIDSNFEFKWNNSVLKSGLENQLEVSIVAKNLQKESSFDTFSSASIQNFDSKVSIKENNFVNAASKGKLIFDRLLLTALPGSNVSLKLLVTLKSNKYYNPDAPISLNLEKVFPFFVRNCIHGEIYRGSDTSCVFCPVGTYSIYDSNRRLPDFCQICPITANCLFNSTIKPKNGYWKAEGNSTLVLECPYPQSCYRINGSECLRGYEGPLCQYCADNFGKSLSSKKCVDCIAHADINLALSFVYFLIFAVYAIITTSLAIRKDESANDSIHCLLNVFITHYQFLAIISQGLDKLKDVEEVTYSFSSNIDVLWDVINPNLCFLGFMKDYQEKFQVMYMMIIAYVTFLILITIAITVFFIFRATFNNSKKIVLFKGSKKRFVITISLFIFNFFYPSLLAVNISKLPCLKIDNYKNHSVMKNIPKLDCFGNFHIFILVTMAIPGIFLFGILIPSILFFLLLKQRDYEVKRLLSISTSRKGSFNTKVINLDQKESEKSSKDDESKPKLLKQNFTEIQTKGNSNDKRKEGENENEDEFVGNFQFKTTELVNFLVKNRIFKFYTKGYKKEFCHWEVGKLYLKFLIAILSNLETVLDLTYIRLLLFFLFYAYSLLLIQKKPFKHRFCNRLELVSIGLCVSFLIFTINNLKGIEFTVFKIFQMIGNGFFMGAFLMSLGILSAKIAKEKYNKIYQSLSRTLAKRRSQRNSKRNSKKISQGADTMQIKIN